ncbi:LuxR C-terminal-related transcriptional regulator [Nocardia arthritidis]|uniref:LuxR family transcriptional regulator n=1 Tax=Nocardia arthritidis TaxID=228602 RepID=A0A6G9Y4Z6_9NOCA|nr:LuxR C-terminal-related transcriptional regulator [Nocardia arthritidis]QIS08272.1 LuxR family transcriptional regulator [Nocardia arthritidis]
MRVEHFPGESSVFVGRVEELAVVGAALAPGRVLTLVGPGGCGKTRLAARVGRERAPDWPDGVCWIDLADESDDAVVVQRVATALALPLPGAADPVGALVHGLGEQRRLLIMDNCEQVRAGVAAVVAGLLAHCAGTGVLTTSRAPLGLAGERLHRVPPLELRDALTLFLDRAGLDSAGQPEREAARQVCDRLDRLPLALELAAGWASTLSLAQLADPLRKPYEVLDGGGPNAPFRQRTLAESMRWSHDLLDADERLLFRALAVFEPGFSSEILTGATELPAGRQLRALRGLIEKSLVSAETGGLVARYRMLGVIREYAALRLAEAGAVTRARDAHLAACRAFVAGVAPLLDTDKDAWCARISLEYANIRAAIDWGLSRRDRTDGRELAAGIAWFWHLGPHGRDGLRRLRAAAEPDTGDDIQARVLVGLALVADTAEPGAAGYENARAAAELADRVGAERVGLLARVLCTICLLGTDPAGAQTAARAVRDAALRADDGFVADAARALLGLTYLLRDELPSAVAELRPAVDGLQRRGDRAVASSALVWLAMASARSGLLGSAAEIAERAVAVAEPLQDFNRIGTARAVLAEIRITQGDIAAAAAALAPMDRLIEGAEARPYIPGWERVHGLLALAENAAGTAIDWCLREAKIYGHNDIHRLTPWTKLVLASALRRGAEGSVRADSLWSNTSASTPTELASELLTELGTDPTVSALPSLRAEVLEEQAFLARGTMFGAAEGIERALRLHHEALRIRAEHGLLLGCVQSLEALAAILHDRGASETAAVLLGATERARIETGSAAANFVNDLRAELKSLPALDEQLARGRSLEPQAAVEYATRARGKRNRPESGWASLTPTERSVVELAVSGMSNPEIADRLFIGRGTVKTHLAHVYAKLGVANRTELARLSAERSSGAEE